MRIYPKTSFLRSIALLLILIAGTSMAWADDLSGSTTVTGYESYNQIFFDFKNNDPSLLPTSGDVRYRESYGLWNYASGRRSVTVSIPVTNGDLLVLQDYTDSNTTINRGTENTSLSSSTGFRCFEISEDADDVTFSFERGKCIVAVLLLSQKYFYMVNASDGTNTLKTLAMGKVTAGESVTIAYPQYIQNGNTLYNIANNGTGDYYRKTITPNTASYIETLNYTNGTVSNVVSYQEAEDVPGVTVVDYTNRASYGRVAHTEGVANYFNATTLSTGAYKIFLRGLNGNNDARQASFKVGDTEVFNFSITQGTNQTGNSSVFQATSSSPLSLSCDRGTAGIDWYYIQAIFAYKESGSTIDVSTSDNRPDLYLPDYDEATYTFTSDNEGVATVDWNGIDAHHNGTATITAKKTIDGVEYYTTHTVTVTGETEATYGFTYDETNKKEDFSISGTGSLPEYCDGTTFNIGFGSTDEIQTAVNNLAHCEDAYGFWHVHLSNGSTGIPDMGTYYIIRPKLGYQGQISIYALVGDDNGTRNGIRLTDDEGNSIYRITSINDSWTTYNFSTELIGGRTYYLFAETGAMTEMLNSAYSNLQLQKVTFTQSPYVNTSEVIEIPSGGIYTITNGTGMSSPTYSIVNCYGELADASPTINSSTGQLSGITAGGTLRIALQQDGFTVYHLLTVAYKATEYPGHQWDFYSEEKCLTTTEDMKEVPDPSNEDTKTLVGIDGSLWVAEWKNVNTSTRPEWYRQDAVSGENALIVPETAGLIITTGIRGFFLRNDADTYSHIGIRNIYEAEPTLTIPFLKAGDIVEILWRHEAYNSGSEFKATNLKDLRGKVIDSNESFAITESAERDIRYWVGPYSFVVADDGDVTFTMTQNGNNDIQSIRIYSGGYRSTMLDVKLEGNVEAPNTLLVDNAEKGYSYTYCNQLHSTATGPAFYVLKGYRSGTDDVSCVQGSDAADEPNHVTHTDENAYPITEAESDALYNLRKNLVGFRMWNREWLRGEGYPTYNFGEIRATSGWGKVTIRMNNYTADMKYLIGYSPDYTLTIGSAPHQEYPYTWDFTHISAQEVTGEDDNAYNSIRNDQYTTNWDTSARGVSLLNVDNSGDTGSQYVPGAILVTTERALSKYSVPENETALYALDELDGLGVNGQIAIHGDLTQNAARTRATIVELLKYNLDDGFTATTELTAGSGTVYFGADNKYVTIDHSQVDATNEHSYQLDGGGSKYIRLTLPDGINFEAGNTITIKAYSNKANGGVTLHHSSESDSETNAYLRATLTLANRYAEETLTYTVSAGDGIESQHQLWIYRANGNTTFVTEVSVKGTSDEIPVINKTLYAASETTLTIPDLNADGKQDWIYVSASAAPTAVTNATIVTSGTDGPDANQSPELEDSNAKVYKYKVTAEGNAYLTFAAGTKIYKIGVTHILKEIHPVGGVGWATESRDHEIDHALTGYFTVNDVNAYTVKYDSYDMKNATVTLTPVNEDGYVVENTGIVLRLDQTTNLSSANTGKYVPLFYPSYTLGASSTPTTFPDDNRMYPNLTNTQHYMEESDGYTKFILTNSYWTFNKDHALYDDESATVNTADAAGFYRMHIWKKTDDVATKNTMAANTAYLRIPSDNLPAAVWTLEDGYSTARGDLLGVYNIIGPDSETAIENIRQDPGIMANDDNADDQETWYTISGMKLSERPTQPGLYIRNGKKVLVRRIE